MAATNRTIIDDSVENEWNLEDWNDKTQLRELKKKKKLWNLGGRFCILVTKKKKNSRPKMV